MASSKTNDMRTPLSKVRGLGSAKTGTGHFFKQRLTALANIPLTLYVLYLLVSLAGASYGDARATLGQPVNAVLIALFLISALYHMKLGMQVIIEDYVHGELAKFVLIAFNLFFAIGLGAIGFFAIIKLTSGA